MAPNSLPHRAQLFGTRTTAGLARLMTLAVLMNWTLSFHPPLLIYKDELRAKARKEPKSWLDENTRVTLDHVAHVGEVRAKTTSAFRYLGSNNM
jgi:hypothetical protein